jgi:ATP-dependent helicase Lhr and Lhr-like helicase
MRQHLKFTWTLFFSRYPALTKVQKLAIPAILAKKDALIISPTASGKTEAVIVPLIERLLSENWQGLAIIYISPTRALCNDLSFRLTELCSELGIKVSIKTGDKPRFNPQTIEGILITTPESFDSILCRYRESLNNLQALILDEIHLVDNTYRGDQLRMLVKRAKSATSKKLNIYMLSATVPSPQKLAGRYAPTMEIIEVPGNRQIKKTFLQNLNEIIEYSRQENLRKILIFCNTRAAVENIANVCINIWGSHQVVVHHGSLSARLRHEAESFMKNNYFGICISTMTLEIGIDIGNLDAVVLADIPLNRSSFLQRIGRSNRRLNIIRVFAICRNKTESLMFNAMFEAANSGLLEGSFYILDYGVIIQQIFSLLYAEPRGISHDNLLDFFSEFCPKDTATAILDNLLQKKWINYRNDIWLASTKLMNLGFIGQIHSNIPDIKMNKIVNIADKKLIGKISGRVDSIFMLAGKIWSIVHKKDDVIFVRSIACENFKAKFKIVPQDSRFSYLLPSGLKKSDQYYSDDLKRNTPHQ